MQKRAVRKVILVVLLGIGIGAAVETWGVVRRLHTVRSEYSELASRLERLQSANTFVAAAQHTYLGSGHPDERSLERVSVLIQQIANETAVIRARIRAANSPSHVQGFADGLAGLIDADALGREHLADGQALTAAETVFRDAREYVEVMDSKLRELRYAESGWFDAEIDRLEARALWTVGGIATVWTLALIVFAAAPAAPEIIAAPVETAPHDGTSAEPPAAPSVDLSAAADLCTAISRLTDAAALSPLLDRAAAILDAPGLIVWMGAGEELFAAASYGYDASTLARLGPIGRTSDNATAAAWRTGEPRIVPGGATAMGALVVPMFATDSCMGVVAVELRNGRETEAATRAVTSMIAAQLATVLSAWPAASRSALDESEIPVPGSESERHAAAS